MTDQPASEQLPPHSEEHSETAGILGLLSSWMGAQKAITGAGSRLLLADSKLAAVTVLQMVILAVVASILIVTIWILLCMLAIIGLVHLGVSLAVAVMLMLLFHFILVCLIVWAIMSSMSGLRFETSRAMLQRVKTEIAPAEE